MVEPVAPAHWGTRWLKYDSLVSLISPSGALEPRLGEVVGIEDYERTLAPALIGYYERHATAGSCAAPRSPGGRSRIQRAVPLAVAYYRALRASGPGRLPRLARMHSGRGPVAFGFDWSFDYYPLAYHRPGPEMTIYRLHGGRCAS